MQETFFSGVRNDLKLHFKLYGYAVFFIILMALLFYSLPIETQKNAAVWFLQFKPYINEFRSWMPKLLVGTLLFELYFGLSYSLVETIIMRIQSKKTAVLLKFFLFVLLLVISGAGAYYSLDLPLVALVIDILSSNFLLPV